MNSPTSDMPAPQVFKDPASCTSEERLVLIEGYRARQVAGQNLTVDELRHAISLTSADRAAAMRERKKAVDTIKKTVAAPSLDEL